jgi:hypothetical protein
MQACGGWATSGVDETRSALQGIVQAGQVAADVIKGIRAMFKADAEARASVDLNALMREVLLLAQGEGWQPADRNSH